MNNLESDIRSEEKEEHKNNICKVIFIILYLLLIAMLFSVFLFYEPAKKCVIQFCTEILNMDFWGYLLFITIFTILVSLGLSYTWMELLIGFGIKKYLPALIIACFVILFCTLLTYVISVYLIKDFIEKKFLKYKKYRALKYYVEENDFKNVFLLRWLYIPAIVKNFLIPVFNLGFINYLLATLLVDILFAVWTVYLGYDAKYFGSFKKSDQFASDIVFVFCVVTTIAIALYMLYYTKKKLEQIENEESLKETKEENL